MNLRVKILLITVSVLILFVASIDVFSSEILMKGFMRLEKENVCQESRRIVDALYNGIYSLDTTNYDWAAWDDTYAFVENRNEAYIESNLVDSTFVALRLNAMLFFNASGNLVYGKAFDLSNESQVDIPDELLEYIREHDSLIDFKSPNESVAGLVAFDKKIAMISSRPILKSNDEGPIRGALIMVRYISDEEIEKISKLLHLSFSMSLLNETNLSGKYFSDNATHVYAINENYVAGLTVLHDIWDKPVAIIKLKIERNIYKEGKTIIHYFIAFFLAVGIVMSIIFSLLVEKGMTSRIVRLSRSVDEIAKSGDATRRIENMGDDEIGRLSMAINNMLEAIEKSEEKIKELLEKERNFRLRTAHYFLNPLCIAKGYLQLLMEDSKDSRIEKVLKAVERVESVVKNIISKGEIKE